MSKAGVDEGEAGGGGAGGGEGGAGGGSLLSRLSAASTGPGWTKVGCPCCASPRVEPLVLVKLGPQVGPETKRWIIRLIGAPQKDGGAGLLAHPGEDAIGDIIVVSAPRCTLLRAAEELGLCKTYRNGDMEAFSYRDRDNFKDSDDMEAFLTLAERQYVVRYELEGVRAHRDLRVPGTEHTCTLQRRDNVWQKLGSAGLILDVFPLHNVDQLKELRDAWYTRNQLSQPLDLVNKYFGSSLAFYFSFLDFYTWSLLPPAVLGLFIASFSGEVQDEVTASDSTLRASVAPKDPGLAVSGHMLQAVFSMLWSTVFLELWKRRSAALSYHWGTMHLAERFAEPRPDFRGELGVNPVTGRVEPLFPEWQRDLRMALVSVPVVGLFLGLVLMGMMGFYWGESLVQDLCEDWDSLLAQALVFLPSVLHVTFTNVLATVYRTAARSLTEFENHREESSFQKHLTVKVLVFTFFNYFAVLFHIAFFKQDLPLLRKRLASLLILTQVINQVVEVVIPFLVDRFISAPKRTEKEDDPHEDKFRNQGSLPPFPGLFGEYIELLVQFGYLSLFSCVYPLTGVLLLINNLTEIRADAYKICKLFRKPFCPPVANMGVWQSAFEVLSFVSVVSNCWLLMLSPQLQEMSREGAMSGTNLLLSAVLVEHLLILVKFVMSVLIPDEPNWLRKKREHIEYLSMQALRQQRLHTEK